MLIYFEINRAGKARAAEITYCKSVVAAGLAEQESGSSWVNRPRESVSNWVSRARER